MSSKDKKSNQKYGTNICARCQKACGGCSWSELDPNTGKPKFKPVNGWTAEEVPLNLGYASRGRRVINTYHITACPEFVKDEKRKRRTDGEISDKDFALLLKAWRVWGAV